MSETAFPAIKPEQPAGGAPGPRRELMDEFFEKQVLNDPEQYQDWSERLEDAGGPKLFTGLQLKVPNSTAGSSPPSTPGGEPTGSRYDVRGFEMHKEEQKHYVRNGVPFIHKAGGRFYIGRGARLPEEDVKVEWPEYTVDKYNAAGELEDILIIGHEKLMKIAGLASEWGYGAEEPTQELHQPGNSRVVRVNTDFGTDDPFDRISKGLESEGVHDWSGLKWQELQPEKGGNRAVHTVEVVRDELISDYHYEGKGVSRGSRQEPTMTRAVVVKETAPDGRVVEKVLKGAEISGHFKKRGEKHGTEEKNKKTIRNMRMTVPEQTRVISQDVEDSAKNIEDRLAYDEDTTLAYLLSYGDVIDPDKEAAAITHNMARVAISADGERRMQALKELINKYGALEIYAAAVELRDQFVETAERLSLPLEFSDPMETKDKDARSISWALESMADRHYYNKHKDNEEMIEAYEGVSLGDPMAAVLGAHSRRAIHVRHTRDSEQLRREIIWEELGWAMVSQTIHKKIDRDIIDLDDDKNPIYKKKIGVQFLGAPLRELPELTREEAKAAEERIYGAIEAKKPAPRADLVHLGRVMERSVTRAPITSI